MTYQNRQERIRIRRQAKPLHAPDNSRARRRTGARTRINLVLDARQIRRLRRILEAPSNSAAVRRAIEERLAVEEGIEAWRDIRKSGGLWDLFGRTTRTRHSQ